MRVGAAIAALVAGAAAFTPSVVRRPAPALRLRAAEPTPGIPRQHTRSPTSSPERSPNTSPEPGVNMAKAAALQLSKSMGASSK